jgi:hypothetical protein
MLFIPMGREGDKSRGREREREGEGYDGLNNTKHAYQKQVDCSGAGSEGRTGERDEQITGVSYPLDLVLERGLYSYDSSSVPLCRRYQSNSVRSREGKQCSAMELIELINCEKSTQTLHDRVDTRYYSLPDGNVQQKK